MRFWCKRRKRREAIYTHRTRCSTAEKELENEIEEEAKEGKKNKITVKISQQTTRQHRSFCCDSQRVLKLSHLALVAIWEAMRDENSNRTIHSLWLDILSYSFASISTIISLSFSFSVWKTGRSPFIRSHCYIVQYCNKRFNVRFGLLSLKFISVYWMFRVYECTG